MNRHLVWLRSDLRTLDNTALLAACQENNSEVACVYAITPQQWQKHDVAGARIDFELRTLAILQKDLERLNIPLLILTVSGFDDLPVALSNLANKHKVSAIHANHQYETNEIARDKAVAIFLEKSGAVLNLHHDQCALPPGTVLKSNGDFYSVFTPFKRNWLNILDISGCQSRPAPKKRRGIFTESDAIPSGIMGFTSHINPETAKTWWPAGETAALKRLASFVEKNLDGYLEKRNFPAEEGSSRLSPYLAAGALSPRQCLNAALNHRARFGKSAGGDQWIAELAWRDFYKHVMVAWPRVCMHRPFKLDTDPLRWRHDEKEFQQWCEGRTGFPLVDAAMRQLQQTGWMHNRLRLVVAMFLTKDLFIDWRWGERFFMRHLIDGDLSANNGGWQWSASTGNDAAPYFRIFNPVAQSIKYDPHGHFIREYIPELSNLPTAEIHEPHGQSQPSLFLNYPPPMINHHLARDRVLMHFKSLRLLTTDAAAAKNRSHG